MLRSLVGSEMCIRDRLSDGTIVLRRADDHDNPIVKIEFGAESRDFLNGEELSVAKEMIRAGLESVSGQVIDFDDFFENVKRKSTKKNVTLH